MCQVSGQGGASALLLQEVSPAEGEAHRYPVVLLEQPGECASLNRAGFKSAQDKVGALPSEWPTSVIMGFVAFAARVMSDTDLDGKVAVRPIGEEAAKKRKEEASMVPCMLFGAPVACAEEDVIAVTLGLLPVR